MESKSLVCVVCKEHVVVEVDSNVDDSLGSLIAELATHASTRHVTEFEDYGRNVSILQSLIPAYFLIESFVDLEATREIDSKVSELITTTQDVVMNTLENNVVISEVSETDPVKVI